MNKYYVQLGQNGQPINYPVAMDNIRYLFPHISLPQELSSSQARELGYGICFVDDVPIPRTPYEKAVPCDYEELSPNVWARRYKFEPLTGPELDDVKEFLGKELRRERFQRLLECDWTQLPDNNLTEEQKELWRVYRQALRDLSLDQTDPSSVQWPEPPSPYF